MRRILVCLLFCLSVLAVNAQEKQFTGFLGTNQPEAVYTFTLQRGEVFNAYAAIISGDLDPALTLETEDGTVLATNDDAGIGILEASLSYVIEQDGRYVVRVTKQPGTAGDFELTIMVNVPEVIEAVIQPPDEVHTGFMSDDRDDARYPVTLAAGESVIAQADAIGDETLDPYLFLLDANQQIIAENDDRYTEDTNSTIVYLSEAGGNYFVVMSNYPATAGDYRLEVTTYAPGDLPVVLREQFSGEPLFFDTEHFRIHYTQQGRDAVTDEYLLLVAEAMEAVYRIQIEEIGWRSPLTDGVVGGDDRFDIYLLDIDRNRGDYGLTVPEPPVFDNPATPNVEERTTASYIVLDNDYTAFDDPEGALLATAAHEFHHAVQFAYDFDEPHLWYLEATASWMETQTFPDSQEADIYIESVFTYPEVCLGADGDADLGGGLLVYGAWLFIDSLTQQYGEEIIFELWENVAIFDNWHPLVKTLAAYESDVPAAVAGYHLRNLVRDYALAEIFEDQTVWLEQTITSPGMWSPVGQGVQELGANYFALDLDTGTYRIRPNSTGELQLWAVLVEGEAASAVPLDNSGLVEVTDAEHVYLLVFNPAYDDDITACTYQEYTIDVQPTTGTALNQNALLLDATNFLPLE